MSRAPNFTPGPWEFEVNGHRARISGGNWFRFAKVVVRMRGDNVNLAEGVANANLITNAPDLYAQLEDARITLGEVAKRLAGDYPSLANNVLNQCAIRCADALAKARGE